MLDNEPSNKMYYLPVFGIKTKVDVAQGIEASVCVVISENNDLSHVMRIYIEIGKSFCYCLCLVIEIFEQVTNISENLW